MLGSNYETSSQAPNGNTTNDFRLERGRMVAAILWARVRQTFPQDLIV